MTAENRLAVYGTLAPGRINHGQLTSLDGTWRRGKVKGRLIEVGWGAALGYPGLILDSSQSEIDVQVFESAELPDHWARLDHFEGAGYQRVITQVAMEDGNVDASIYVVEG